MTADPISAHAACDPKRLAVVMGDSGAKLTYGELDGAANRGAHLLRAAGLQSGDTLAVCLENRPEFFQVACAALRSGLVLVLVSARLTPAEIAFIVRDSGAAAVVVSAALTEACGRLPDLLPELVRFSVGSSRRGFRSWDTELSYQPAVPIPDGCPGREMLYSSGTTGRPKGIDYLGGGGRGAIAATRTTLERLGVDSDDVYFGPAPLYHAAPFGWAMAMLQMGATVVAMERFDAEGALALIERHDATVSQWVPTHFVRMLKLPEATRALYDLRSMRLAVHAAAPCPADVKRAMIDWWGPILFEYFGSSEQTALTFITSEEWLAHPGSVGRCVQGTLHICDDAGEPLPPGEIGQIYVEGGVAFAYHNDPEKTACSRNRHGWTTVGDMGRLDEEGYLYLADRKDFMIITGGVNVYPQEIENLLVAHPRIADAAVIGAPDDDLGEIVTAIVQPVDMAEAGPAFAEEIRQWLRHRLSGVKTPKRVEFRAELPRLPTGKMAKHLLRG